MSIKHKAARMAGVLAAATMAVILSFQFLSADLPEADFNCTGAPVYPTDAKGDAPLRDAIKSASAGATLCLHKGTYDEILVIDKALTVIAEPGAIIDGDRVRPGGEFAALVQITGQEVTVSGLEVRNSTGRGVNVGYPAKNVTLSDLTVHDNWDVGIHVSGTSGTKDLVEDVVVQDSEVYYNARHARVSPAVFKAVHTGSAYDAWHFNLDEAWDKPFWTDGDETGCGANTLPHENLDALDFDFDSGGQIHSVYLSIESPQVKTFAKEGTIDGQELRFNRRDVLIYDQLAHKYGMFFKAESALKDKLASGFSINDVTDLDAFSFLPGCDPGVNPYCPFLISFAKAGKDDAVVPSVELAGLGSLYGSDILKFTPTATGVATAGTFEIYRRYDAIGFSMNDDIDAIAFAPNGKLVVSTSSPYQFPNPAKPTVNLKAANGDLIICTAGSGGACVWNFYFTDVTPNPMGQSLWAATIDEDGNLYLSGRVEGGIALGFIYTKGGQAINNDVHDNFAEGLVAGRVSRDTLLLNNRSWNNKHASLYINTSVKANVRNNFVYCTDNRDYWGKGNQAYCGAAPGLGIRDENFDVDVGVPNGEQLQIVNNIVVGCDPNFFVDSQIATGGLINSVVTHNTFVQAQGDPGAAVQNVTFTAKASYTNSQFVNNLTYQEGGTGGLIGGTPAALFFGGNLCNSGTAGTGGCNIVSDPHLWSVEPIEEGESADPSHYQLTGDSTAAINAAVDITGAFPGFAGVTDDFFGFPRDDGDPDIGAHEYVSDECLRAPLLELGDVADGLVYSEPQKAAWKEDHYRFRVSSQGYVLLYTRTDAPGLVSLNRINGPELGRTPVNGDGLLFSHIYEGDYCISVYPDESVEPPASSRVNYDLSLSSPLLVSTGPSNSRGQVAGIEFDPADILAHSDLNNGEEQWLMFLDGSDVGITGNISNIAVDGGMSDRLLIGVSQPQSLPGVGPVQPADIVVFDPTQLGPDTQGAFSMGLAGSRHQLTGNGERIDGLDGWVFGYGTEPPDSDLYGCFGYPVSVSGIARVTGWLGEMRQNDEDVFCKVYDEAHGGFRPWDWFFDVKGMYNPPETDGASGDIPGLDGNDVVALAYNDHEDKMYLTIGRRGHLWGHLVKRKDIVAINYPDYTWGGIVWHGPDHGWRYNIDAFEWNGW